MLEVFPDYYKDFKCIKGACRHNCCIGWEIDIDHETAAFYDTVKGKLGEKLRQNISREGEPHFILGENERCPFLNKSNLCDLIIELGEENLCGICADHPRFRNELPDRTETGLGLCCEAAARLILGREAPVKFESIGEGECADDIIIMRDEIIGLLQQRGKSIEERVEEMLSLCEAVLPRLSIDEWAERLLKLERLDDSWTRLINLLKDNWQRADIEGFGKYMAYRQSEYEQLLVYLIYRHFANAPDMGQAAARALFAVFGYRLIYAIGSVIHSATGEFTFEQQVEIVRLFSSEIEYSDENLYIILDALAEY